MLLGNNFWTLQSKSALVCCLCWHSCFVEERLYSEDLYLSLTTCSNLRQKWNKSAYFWIITEFLVFKDNIVLIEAYNKVINTEESDPRKVIMYTISLILRIVEVLWNISIPLIFIFEEMYLNDHPKIP